MGGRHACGGGKKKHMEISEMYCVDNISKGVHVVSRDLSMLFGNTFQLFLSPYTSFVTLTLYDIYISQILLIKFISSIYFRKLVFISRLQVFDLYMTIYNYFLIILINLKFRILVLCVLNHQHMVISMSNSYKK